MSSISRFVSPNCSLNQIPQHIVQTLRILDTFKPQSHPEFLKACCKAGLCLVLLIANGLTIPGKS